MRTLLLLRHAKSSWDDHGLADYDRPLAKRGLKAAPRMGEEIGRLGLRPTLIICSGAKRTRQTLELAVAAMGGERPQVAFDDAIYMASPAALLTLIRQQPPGADTDPLMIVGHNPGLEELAQELVGSGEAQLRGRLASKFPTGTLAVITFPEAVWTAVAPGRGTLQHFLTPATLT